MKFPKTLFIIGISGAIIMAIGGISRFSGNPIFNICSEVGRIDSIFMMGLIMVSIVMGWVLREIFSDKEENV